jgi:hypothetical protein
MRHGERNDGKCVAQRHGAHLSPAAPERRQGYAGKERGCDVATARVCGADATTEMACSSGASSVLVMGP